MIQLLMPGVVTAAAPVITSPLETQLYAAAALEYALRWMQKSVRFQWITEHTGVITSGFRGLLAAIATVGITWRYSATEHQLVINGLSLATIGLGFWHWFGTYAMMHGFGGLIRGGNLDKFQAIVADVVKDALAAQKKGP